MRARALDPNFIRTLALILLAVTGGTFGDTFLSVGMRRMGELNQTDVRSLVAYFWRALTSPFVMGGISCLAIYFFTWLVVLSEADLSLALPMTALTFILGTLLARFWIGETVSLTRWCGTSIIALGVVIVALSGAQQTSSVQRPPLADAGPLVSTP